MFPVSAILKHGVYDLKFKMGPQANFFTVTIK